jgi:hypothetical protein
LTALQQALGDEIKAIKGCAKAGWLSGSPSPGESQGALPGTCA